MGPVVRLEAFPWWPMKLDHDQEYHSRKQDSAVYNSTAECYYLILGCICNGECACVYVCDQPFSLLAKELTCCVLTSSWSLLPTIRPALEIPSVTFDLTVRSHTNVNESVKGPRMSFCSLRPSWVGPWPLLRILNITSVSIISDTWLLDLNYNVWDR